MRALDASYRFDLLRGDAGARDRALEWEGGREHTTVPAPVLAEFLRAGYQTGGRFLDRSLTLVRRLEVLPLDAEAADEAGRLSGECDWRGEPVGNLDLLIAGIVRKRDGILVSRGRDFQRIPGLHLESS